MPEVLDIALRPITDADLPFLGRLYAGTRQQELAVTGWPQQQIDAFLAQQFAAQHKYYSENYHAASFDLILDPESGEPVGRLYLDRRDGEIRIVDIALLPEWRGRGIGGGILRGILSEAGAAGKSVSIHVEANNPAMSLYLRLGFHHVADNGIYHLMEWSAPE
ncbi:MAG: GNAT family N-acetyltransferase [Akkermansiaceae bacterium]|nr:GNAT family N-acetyltransferase [Akkermansiaceae bacterium]